MEDVQFPLWLYAAKIQNKFIFELYGHWLVHTINTEDFYADIRNDVVNEFDTSDYPQNNIFNIPLVNKKVLGKMKDENCGKIMMEFVGLRSKMYSFTSKNGDEVKKSKGVKKCILNKYNIASYRDCLFNKTIIFDNMLTFQSKLHVMFTKSVYKSVLDYRDQKRYIKENNVDTLAFNHYLLQNT